MKHLTIGVVALAFLTLSCGTTLKRYSSIAKSKQNNDLVQISMLPTSIVEPGSNPTFKTIFDLTEKGQAAVLTNKSNEQISELLNKKFQEEQNSKSRTVDLTKKNVRITFSIYRKVKFEKDDLTAFDRIEDLKYSFELLPSMNNNIKFTKWNKYTTEYGTLDIGTLEYNQSFTANLDVTGEIGANHTSKSIQKIDEENSRENSTTIGPKLSATGKVGYGRSQKENQSIKQKFIQLTGEFGKRKFAIHQQGNREAELAGNVNIELTISLPKDEMIMSSFSNLFDNKLKRSDMKDVNLNLVRYYVPNTDYLPNGVIGSLDYNFAVRNILFKAKTFPELDDRIRYITGTNKVDNLVLLEKEDVTTTTYFFVLGETPMTIDSSTTLQFLDFEKALEFKTWLIQTIQNLDETRKVEISNYVISFKNITTKEMKKRYKDIKIEVYKN